MRLRAQCKTQSQNCGNRNPTRRSPSNRKRRKLPMARYVKGSDKDGWKKGAGPYSRSYAKLSDTPPPGFAGHYPKSEGPQNFKYNNRGAVARVQDLIRGKDISAKVDRASGP